MTELHYLTQEEERAIKRNLPWEHIDRSIRDLVLQANSVYGIATLQSCAGHITVDKNKMFVVGNAHIALRATKERTDIILQSNRVQDQ